MCMIDGADYTLELLNERTPRAAKPYWCDECDRAIAAGETYCYEAGRMGDAFETYRTCAHCNVARAWLAAECGGWVYLGVYEDLEEHWHEGHRSLSLGRLIVGMRRKWARFDGAGLMSVPEMSTTSAPQ